MLFPALRVLSLFDPMSKNIESEIRRAAEVQLYLVL